MALTAPRWAQALGMTTRHQALAYQARALGFESRSAMERHRKSVYDRASRTRGRRAEQIREEWRRNLEAQTQAAIVRDMGMDTVAQRVANRAAAMARDRLNAYLPVDLTLPYPVLR